MTEIEEQEDYEVRIGSFNGPMDLLVYLVQKKEMRGRLPRMGQQDWGDRPLEGGRFFVHGEPPDGPQSAGTAPGRRTRPGTCRGIQRRPRKAHAGDARVPALQAGRGRAPGHGRQELRHVQPWPPRKDAERRGHARRREHLAAFPRVPEEPQDKDFGYGPPHRTRLRDHPGPATGDKQLPLGKRARTLRGTARQRQPPDCSRSDLHGTPRDDKDRRGGVPPERTLWPHLDLPQEEQPGLSARANSLAPSGFTARRTTRTMPTRWRARPCSTRRTRT